MSTDVFAQERERNGVTQVRVIKTVWTMSGPASRCEVHLVDGSTLVRDYAGEAYSRLMLHGEV